MTTRHLERPSHAAATLPAKFRPHNYDHLIGMPGFSEKMLTTHFKLYQGYVTNTNSILEKLSDITGREEKAVEFAELKRRLGWEYNGMRLHEYYFDNLGGKKEEFDDRSSLVQRLKEQFGSFDQWKKDFTASGAMRGIGWVILYHDPASDRLTNFWIEEHHTNHLAGGHPLLVLDVFEHAYIADYGTDKAKYMESFFKNINWTIVNDRLPG